ncbi:hypothetical protein PVIIG_05236 [Plasmodium vivax India VII]|uniref:PIR Superfamily Protein n=1 Tax=Plasmodium vivax India VII TaxID=1077284 RepID=A0A0J9S2S6_PLAVI|nr:hypothetical protein PVIIG_05236 [Plasmodium vivax India VII]
MVIYDSEKGDQVEDKFVSYCKGSVTDNLYNKSEYINLCVQINRYFQMFSNENNPKNKHCEYLNYWLNDQYKINKANILYKSILDTPVSFRIFDNSIPHVDKYKNKIGHIEDDIFKRIDVIHDLYKEYSTFLLLFSKENTRNQSCNFARKCSQLYNDNIGDCHDSNNKFCKALESFKQKYISHGISMFLNYTQQKKHIKLKFKILHKKNLKDIIHPCPQL